MQQVAMLHINASNSQCRHYDMARAGHHYLRLCHGACGLKVWTVVDDVNGTRSLTSEVQRF